MKEIDKSTFFSELVQRSRSYRRFFEDQELEEEFLHELVDIARLTPSSRNLQPLKYFISCDKDTNSTIFKHLAWAGYLKEWDGPEEGERPSAYIIILEDKNIGEGFLIDQGIAAQTIMLGLAEKDLSGCIVGSINRAELAKDLNLSDNLSIGLVIAIGRPKEIVAIYDIEPSEDIRYWRDENEIHHVPKRKLDEVLVQGKCK